MITIELRRNDLAAYARIDNLTGAFFAGTSPLIRPLIDRLQGLLPPEKRGLGTGYTIGALRGHASSIRADSSAITVEIEGKSVCIERSELEWFMAEKFPGIPHNDLNLAGLLFLQSGPAMQAATVAKLWRDHRIRIPDGRRTQRYVFHIAVVSLDADQERVLICLDMERLPGISCSATNKGL
jgi:hypothetical protein